MNFNQYFCLGFAIAILIAPDPSSSIDPIGGAIVAKKVIGKKVIVAKKAVLATAIGAKKAIVPITILGSKFLPAVAIGSKLPLLAIKKGILLAPIAIPLAIGAKAATLATGAVAMAVPAAIGAAVGAPLGAIIGAKAGAIKGAAVGRALLGIKLALGAKAAGAGLALGAKAAGVGLALAAKPVVLVVGAKAKAAALGVHFIGKGIGLAGKGVLVAGKSMAHFGQKMSDASLAVKGIGTQVADQLKSSIASIQLPEFSEFLPAALPALPSLETFPAFASINSIGPKSLDASITLNTPLTGEKFTRASMTTNLRKRRQVPITSRAMAAAAARPPVIPPNQLDRLVKYVHSQNLQGCLARVICELSANPNIHGPEGIRFGSSLLTMSRTTNPAAGQFRAASQTGTQLRNNPAQCRAKFPMCQMNSADVVQMGNNMLASAA